MTEKELKKLRRIDLLEMLIALDEENQKLRKELVKARKQLAQRKLILEKSGSIAEAALRLNGVFEAAQAAADQYLLSIGYRKEEAADEKE